MVERRDRADAAGQQPVDEAPVEGETLLIGRAAAGRLDARPGDREPVGVQAEGLHQVEVFLEVVVVVAGLVAGVAVLDLAGRVAEGVPDRRTPTVLVERPLDLVRGGGRTEDESLRELEPGVAVIGVALAGNGHERVAFP